MQMDEINFLKREQGNWHGELFDTVKGEDLKYVLAHPNVDAVMIKGPWQSLREEWLKIVQNWLSQNYF